RNWTPLHNNHSFLIRPIDLPINMAEQRIHLPLRHAFRSLFIHLAWQWQRNPSCAPEHHPMTGRIPAFQRARWLSAIMLLCVGWHIQSQPVSFFEIVPDLGALRGQSQGLNIMGDSLHVYVLGDMIDTQTLPGDTSIRPFYARFDYQGHITAMRTLYDPNAPGEFYMLDGAKPILKKAGTVYFYGSQLDEKSNFHGCMIELDEDNGHIRQYTCYPHPPSADSSHGAQNYDLDQNGNIIAYHYLYKERGIAIREIDTSFRLIREVLVEIHPRSNHPLHIERDTDSS